MTKSMIPSPLEFKMTSPKTILTCCVLLTILLGRTTAAINYYVSPDGNDLNYGTSTLEPLRTIQQAADIARPGDTIYIRGGTYREAVRPTRSGTPGNPIIFRTYNNEEVIINGTELVTDWTLDSGNTYRATLPGDFYVSSYNEALQIFADEQMLFHARWPNTPMGEVSLPNFAETDNFVSRTVDETTNWVTGVMEDSDISSFPADSLDGAEIYFRPNNGSWVFLIGGTITGNSGSQFTFQTRSRNAEGLSDSDKANVYAPDSQYYLFGKQEFLDDLGEWYHDKENDTLYLIAPDGLDPNNLKIEAKRREYGMDLSERSHIEVHDIKFFACTITTDKEAAGDRIPYDSDGEQLFPGRGVNDGIASASNILISGIEAKYVTHFEDVSGHNNFQWPIGSGVVISGSDITLRDSLIQYSGANGIYVAGRNNLITNNFVYDTNYNVLNGGAITVRSWAILDDDGETLETGAEDIQISHNTIERTGKHGILAGQLRNSDPTQIKARINHNLVKDYGLQDWDNGGIYAGLSDGNFARFDHNVFITGEDTKHYTAGPYIDFGKNYTIDHNVIIGVDWGITLQGLYILGEVVEAQALNNTLVYNNTIMTKDLGADWRQFAFGGGWPDSRQTGTIVKNNIAFNLPSSGGRFDEYGPSYVDHDASNNLIWDGVPGSTTDPHFTDYLNGDFTLTAPSNAIDQGETLTALTYDGNSIEVYNNPVSGAGVDIGAYEFGQPAWTAGASFVAKEQLGTPRNFELTLTGDTEVTLSWLDGATSEEGYLIEQLIGDTETWATAASIPANSTEHTLTGLQPNTEYRFRVTAFNGGGSSSGKPTQAIATLTHGPFYASHSGLLEQGPNQTVQYYVELRNVSSSFQTFTITGPSPLVFESPAITIAPSSSGYFAFKLDSAGLATGDYTSTLSVTSNLPRQHDFTIPLDIRISNTPKSFSASKESMILNENGGIGTFTVQLASMPSSNVVLDVISTDTTEATVSPSQLVFTPSNWNTSQTVTATGINDTDGLQDDRAAILINVNTSLSDDDFHGHSGGMVGLTLATDETPGSIIYETSTLTVVEDGFPGTIGVRLGEMPTSSVTLDITNKDPSLLSISPSSLTFTPANWNTDQQILVSGIDNETVGAQMATFTVSVNDAESDNSYDLLATQTVNVQITDDDNTALLSFTFDEGKGTTSANNGSIPGDLIIESSTINAPIWKLASGLRRDGIDHSLFFEGNLTGGGDSVSGPTHTSRGRIETNGELNNLSEWSFSCWYKEGDADNNYFGSLLSNIDFHSPSPREGISIALSQGDGPSLLEVRVNDEVWYTGGIPGGDDYDGWRFLLVTFDHGTIRVYVASPIIGTHANGTVTLNSTDSGVGMDDVIIGSSWTNWGSLSDFNGALDNVEFTPSVYRGIEEVEALWKSSLNVSAPSSLTAAVANRDIQLNWQDNSDNELNFVVERRLSDGGVWQNISGLLPADTTQYFDTTAEADTVYEYRVRAGGKLKDSTNSDVVSFTVPVDDGRSALLLFTFDEGEGTTSQNLGTIDGDLTIESSNRDAPTWLLAAGSRQDGTDNALTFNGEQTGGGDSENGPTHNSRGRFETNGELNNLNQWSLSGWYQGGQPSGQLFGYLFSNINFHSTGARQGISIAMLSFPSQTPRPQLEIHVNGESWYTGPIADSYSSDWRFLAVTFNNGEAKLYTGDSETNAQLVATHNFSVSDSGIGMNTVLVGSSWARWANHLDFNGSLDNIEFTEGVYGNLAEIEALRLSAFSVAAPTSLTATITENDDVHLSWQDNADNEFYYVIERKLSSDTNWQNISGLLRAGTTQFTDATALAGIDYDYRVRAGGKGMDSADSNTARSSLVSNTPPSVNIAASSGGNGHVGQAMELLANAFDNETAANALNYQWSLVSGPSTAVFSDVNSSQLLARFGAIGSYTLEVSVDDGVLSDVDQVTLTIEAPTSYNQEWIDFAFVEHPLGTSGAHTDRAADANGDGMPNLFDYSVLAPHGLLRATDADRMPRMNFVEVSDQDFFEFSYRRIQGGTGDSISGYSAAGITYRVEFTDDMGASWSSESTDIEEVGMPLDHLDGTETVRVRVKRNISAENPQAFLRLRVE